jgi:hypothetical protein
MFRSPYIGFQVGKALFKAQATRDEFVILPADKDDAVVIVSRYLVEVTPFII